MFTCEKLWSSYVGSLCAFVGVVRKVMEIEEGTVVIWGWSYLCVLSIQCVHVEDVWYIPLFDLI